ncbi:MAG: type VI secretion system baseplate subunit TssE, partial [Acidobacteriota bacterium]|nr:type VI secretion system baseplate subunit TssE [Acidobacteriota bacterium]
ARTDSEIRITPSVFDRLLDYEPTDSREAPKSRSKSLRELKQSVRRDLEWLLNTRCYPEGIDEKLEEVLKSVVFFGLPDFTGVSAKNYLEQKRLTQAVETAIRYFEPRFMDVKVRLEPFDSVDRVLRFRIEANLDIDPTPEPVAFDTVLQLGSGDFQVQEK